MIRDKWDLAWRLATRMKFRTCEQNWDLYETISGLFSETKFFRNRNRDFLSETKFSETETETFFRDQIFSKPKLFSETKFSETVKKLAKVSKPKCQSLVDSVAMLIEGVDIDK